MLGFEVEVDEPEMGLVLLRRETVGLALVQSATPGVNRTTAAYIGVTGVDDLHEQCAAHGARIVTGLADHPWGLRDFVVEMPGGHRLVSANASHRLAYAGKNRERTTRTGHPLARRTRAAARRGSLRNQGLRAPLAATRNNDGL